MASTEFANIISFHWSLSSGNLWHDFSPWNKENKSYLSCCEFKVDGADPDGAHDATNGHCSCWEVWNV